MQATPSLLFTIKLLVTGALLLLMTGACKTYSEEDKSGFDAKIERFIEKKDWNMNKSESGLYMEVLQEGNGDEPVISGSIVSIAYKGTLLNGKVFDRRTAEKPLESELRGLIMGFREGLLGQKKGAKIRLVVPPQLGYGDLALDKIPSNSVLQFDIELLDVK